MTIARSNDINFEASVDKQTALSAGKTLKTKYIFEAFDPEGNLKWRDEFDNLVVNEGLDDSLDKHFKASAYTAGWYVGITDGTPSFDPADTMGSHVGWSEVTAYSEAVRPTLVLGTVSGQSVDNSANKAVYSINANSTVIGGAFVTSDATKGGAVGTLYGGGAFSTGDKSLDDGDTLNVTVVLTAAAS